MGNRPDLFKQETLKPKNLSNTLARLGGYFSRFWYMLIVVLALITLSTWTQVITPELTGQATDCFLVPLGNQFDAFGPLRQAQGDAQADVQSENSLPLLVGTTDPAS